MRDHEVLAVLDSRLHTGTVSVLAGRDATILLDAGDEGRWTIRAQQGELRAEIGRTARPDTTISADVDVLLGIATGELSGVHTFLEHGLMVRGDLSLALQMDGIFVDEGRPAHFTRAGLVRVEGVDTAYLEAGPADAPPVVLVHGLGATNASMLPLLAALARTHRVLAPDLPGHGATAPARHTYAPAFLAQWLHGFQAATHSSPAAIIGNSLGGRVALEAGLLHPSDVSGLILLSPAVAFRKLRQFVPIVNVLRPELSALPIPPPRRLAMRVLRSLFAQPSRLPDYWYDAAVDEFTRVMGSRHGRIAFFAALRQIYLDKAFGPEGFWDRLPGLKMPALFIWGDHDVLVPAGFARHVERAVPHAISVVLTDCGHVPQFELPERVAELTRDFLAMLSWEDARGRS